MASPADASMRAKAARSNLEVDVTPRSAAGCAWMGGRLTPEHPERLTERVTPPSFPAAASIIDAGMDPSMRSWLAWRQYLADRPVRRLPSLPAPRLIDGRHAGERPARRG
jgi:hypothetical protein